MDALDIETFLVCKSEAEGKELALQLVKDMGIRDADVVFIQYKGPGARVRVRGYMHRPGVSYGWLQES
ncbi:MAG: hypothetical protein H0Z35_04255 [Thermoanaerobacteraceae bacterium]|nr:hypothetical protein [Thermoanaerobacteraceae bacterium]